MVGTVPPSLHLQTAASPSSSATAAAVAGVVSVAATTAVASMPEGGGGVVVGSAEEEAYKRNTDCVYFLASPLTCKKGSDCEYRHSDIARVNPRDCWYWLHGNCLNPKCGFRHPPLDGLLGSELPNPMGPSVPVNQPATQPATQPAAPVSYASGKQGVPCIFFQKGNCLKGDWCPFLHAPNSANNKVLHSQAAIPATEPPTYKKTMGGQEKFTQKKKILQESVLTSSDLTQTKPMAKVEPAPATQEINVNKNLPPSNTGNELHGCKTIDSRPANNGNRLSWPSHVLQPGQVNEHTITLSAKDPEEVSRDPSPGFDVLVDNELGDSDYYQSEDHFGRTRDREGMNEYYDGRSGDYGPLVNDQGVYHDSRGYGSYEQHQDQYAWEQHRSSERMSRGLAYPERRRYGKADNPDQVDESDLRHQLSKHRRVNGLRSVITHDYAPERPDEQGYQGCRRDLLHDRERRENSLSSRLRGRIKVPGMSSVSTDGSDLRHDRETKRGRDHSGLSPGRSQVSSRLRDRIKGKVPEDVNNDGRNNRGLCMRRDVISDFNVDFAAPKSLAELKSLKSVDGSDQQSMGKRKFSNIDYQRQTVNDLSFEGPKPLEEILKRKRGTETDNDQNKSEKGSVNTKATERQVAFEFESKPPNHNENEEYKSVSSLKTGSEVAQSGDSQSLSHKANVAEVEEGMLIVAQSGDSQSLSHKANVAEVEEGMLIDDGAEDGEPEAYDHGNEDYYEQGDGNNYNLDEGENGDAEEEYLDDDDDGDDFAKKMGVMY